MKVTKDDDFKRFNEEMINSYKRRPLQQNLKLKMMLLKSATKIELNGIIIKKDFNDFNDHINKR